ncbi:MAG: hypothetical protein RL336_2079 [Pseudomonadota bacterium]
MISIRRAQPSDVATILGFIRQLAIYEKAEHEVVASAEQTHAALFGEHAHCEAMIAENMGTPIGFALYFFNYSTWLGRPGLYLEDLFVTPDSRGLGAGKALLKSLAKVAVERGCGRFEWSVLDWNTPAIDFYESLGAEPQSEWTIYRVTGDALQALAK